MKLTPQEKVEWTARRRDYVVQGPCAVCGGAATDCHEILAGANRQAAWVEPACWLRVCRPCHDAVQGRTVEYQLALKLLNDPHHFDLQAFCKAWGRAPSAIDGASLIEFIRLDLL